MSGTVFIIPDDPSVAVIAFDGTMNETHSLAGSLTDNPIEDGSVIADHFIARPIEFSCEVKITETPDVTTFENEGAVLPLNLSFPVQVPSLVLIPGTPKLRPPAIQALQFLGLPSRIKRALDNLTAIFGTGTVSVITARKQYDQMVLIGIDEAVSSIFKADLKLTFKILKTVTTETVAAPKPKEPRGVPPTKAGDQEVDLFNPTTWFNDTKQSALSKIVDKAAPGFLP